MGRRTDLPDAEAAALKAWLQAQVDEADRKFGKRYGDRLVGGRDHVGEMLLGAGVKGAQAKISRMLTPEGRVGLAWAGTIYKYLFEKHGISREQFLRERNAWPAENLERRVLRLAAGTGLPSEDLLVVIESLGDRGGPGEDEAKLDDEIRRAIAAVQTSQAPLTPRKSSSEGPTSAPGQRGPRAPSQASEGASFETGVSSGKPGKRT